MVVGLTRPNVNASRKSPAAFFQGTAQAARTEHFAMLGGGLTKIWVLFWRKC